MVRTTTTSGGHHRIADSEIDRLIAKTSSPSSGAERKRRVSSGYIVALSGRNRLGGFIEEVRVDGLLGQVRLRIGDQTLTAVITADAIRELKLRRGDEAIAIIKSTEVMIAREAELPVAPRRGTAPLKGRTPLISALHLQHEILVGRVESGAQNRASLRASTRHVRTMRGDAQRRSSQHQQDHHDVP